MVQGLNQTVYPECKSCSCVYDQMLIASKLMVEGLIVAHILRRQQSTMAGMDIASTF